MTSYTTDKVSIRSSSPIIIHDNYTRNSLFLLCCGCSRPRKNSQQLSTTIEDTKNDVPKGFFKRIQFFKGLKTHELSFTSSVSLSLYIYVT
jgi:hypothetical protein